MEGVGAKEEVVAGDRAVEVVEAGGRLALGTREDPNGLTHQQHQDGVEPLRVDGLKGEEVQDGVKLGRTEVQAGIKQEDPKGGPNLLRVGGKVQHHLDLDGHQVNPQDWLNTLRVQEDGAQGPKGKVGVVNLVEGGIGAHLQVGVKGVQGRAGTKVGKGGAKDLRVGGVSHPLDPDGVKEVLLQILPGVKEEEDLGGKDLRLVEAVMGAHGTRGLMM